MTTVPSAAAATNPRPSGVNASPATSPEASTESRSAPVASSYSRTVRSSPARASEYPVGEKANPATAVVGPPARPRSRPVFESSRRTVFPAATARARPSELYATP